MAVAALWLWELWQQFPLVQLRAGSPPVAPVVQGQLALRVLHRVVVDQVLGGLPGQHRPGAVLAVEALRRLALQAVEVQRV